jgi:hypothetical protein
LLVFLFLPTCLLLTSYRINKNTYFCCTGFDHWWYPIAWIHLKLFNKSPLFKSLVLRDRGVAQVVEALSSTPVPQKSDSTCHYYREHINKCFGNCVSMYRRNYLGKILIMELVGTLSLLCTEAQKRYHTADLEAMTRSQICHWNIQIPQKGGKEIILTIQSPYICMVWCACVYFKHSILLDPSSDILWGRKSKSILGFADKGNWDTERELNVTLNQSI